MLSDAPPPFFNAQANIVNGLVDTLLSSITRLDTCILYFIIPSDFANRHSSDFGNIADIFSATAPYIERQFVPVELINTKRWKDNKWTSFVLSTYERQRRLVERTAHRKEFVETTVEHTWIDAPAYTIATAQGAASPQFKYSLNWESRTMMDATDRHLILHVGYRFGTNGKWLYVAGIDQRGDGHQLKAWELDELGDPAGDESREDKTAKFVLALAREMTGMASAEWVVVICKLGPLTFVEIEGGFHLCSAMINMGLGC